MVENMDFRIEKMEKINQSFESPYILLELGALHPT